MLACLNRQEPSTTKSWSRFLRNNNHLPPFVWGGTDPGSPHTHTHIHTESREGAFEEMERPAGGAEEEGEPSLLTVRHELKNGESCPPKLKRWEGGWKRGGKRSRLLPHSEKSLDNNKKGGRPEREDGFSLKKCGRRCKRRRGRRRRGRNKGLEESVASGVKGSGMPWGSRPGGRCRGWQPREGAATGPKGLGGRRLGKD